MIVNTYKVKSIDPASNTRSTTWVRAETRQAAKQYVAKMYDRHMVESALPRSPPDEVTIHDATSTDVE